MRKCGCALLLAWRVYAADLTADDILQRSAEAERTQAILRAQYFYREHAIRSTGPGKITYTQDFENIVLEGEPYRRLVLRDGKPLDRKRAEEEERKLQLTAAERRAERAQPQKSGPKVIPFSEARPADLLRVMDNKLVREEVLHGRQSWVIESEPKRDLVPADAIDQKLACYRYVLWIDQQDFVIAQRDSEVVREGAESRPGSKLRSVFRKEDDLPWFRHSMEGEFFTSAPKAHWFQKHSFSGFKKFQAESKIEFGKEKP